MTEWVASVCRLPLVFRTGDASIRQLFEPARDHISDRASFLAAAGGYLRAHPDLVEEWRTYSLDKRTGRGPSFGTDRDPLEVGFYDAGYHDVRRHADAVEACVDFVHREAVWVLTGDAC